VQTSLEEREMATTWIDQTLRLSLDPTIGLDPTTDEFEISWSVTEVPDSRVTIRISTDSLRRLIDEASEMLALRA
jgi:hypothetical protein